MGGRADHVQYGSAQQAHGEREEREEVKGVETGTRLERKDRVQEPEMSQRVEQQPAEAVSNRRR